MNANNIKQTATQAGMAVSASLGQHLNVTHGKDYAMQIGNSQRVFVLTLRGLNPAYNTALNSMVDELSIATGLDDSQKIRVGRKAGAIYLEVPKPKSMWDLVRVENLKKMRAFKRGPVATLGLAVDGRPMRLDFRGDATGHALVAGESRSGKTTAQMGIAWNMAMNSNPLESRMIIFDTEKKGFKWNQFSNSEMLLTPIVTDIETAERALFWLVQEIERRAEGGITEPRIFLFIDELKLLLEMSECAGDYLDRIAAIGAEFGIHAIVATQFLKATSSGKQASAIKHNLTIRLCGRVDSAQAAVNAMGASGTGAETLQGYGDFLMKNQGDVNRLTVAHVQPKHFDMMGRGEIINPIQLPDIDDAHVGLNVETPKSHTISDYTPEQMGLALIETHRNSGKVGRVKLAKALSHLGIQIGSNSKTTALAKFAGDVYEFCQSEGMTFC